MLRGQFRYSNKKNGKENSKKIIIIFISFGKFENNFNYHLEKKLKHIATQDRAV